jgi:hypothetical protein
LPRKEITEEIEESVASTTMVPPLVPEMDLEQPRKGGMRKLGLVVLSVAIIFVLAAAAFFVLNP